MPGFEAAALVEPLLTEEQITERCMSLAAEIDAAYPDEPVLVVGILKGSVLFMADLVRHLQLDVQLEFMGVSSYAGTESTGVVRITDDLKQPITGRHVLVVEDIVDTGLTLAYLRRVLSAQNPASLRVVTLLDKPDRRQVEVEAEFIGFTIPDAFVVGYGLDFDQRFRQLPYVGIYRGPTDE